MSLKKAKITKKTQLTEDVIELTLSPEEKIKFEAGQYVSIKINDDIGTPCMRAYSIASAPYHDFLQLCIKVTENGRGSNWLNSLQEGDEIEFLGPMGKFTFIPAPQKTLNFIATGTGIAPFKAMIDEQLQKGFSGQINLIFGLRHIKGVFYQDFFEQLAKDYENFDFIITLTRPENANWKGSKGRVTNILEEKEFDADKNVFYICGLKDMIASVSKILIEKGVKEDNLHYEKYD